MTFEDETEAQQETQDQQYVENPFENNTDPNEQNVDTVPPEEVTTEATPETENTESSDKQPSEPDKPETEKPTDEKKQSKWDKFMGRGDRKLEEKIQELQQKLDDMTKLRLLALAELDNMRKRLPNERAQIRKNTIQDTLMPFLQVFEYFTMAMKSVEQKQNYDAIAMGMKMIFDQFGKAFDDLDVERIDALGKKFDPNLHEAVGRESSDTVPEGVVLKQWNIGFKCGDRLLKAARVIVSSGPAPQEQPQAQTEEETSPSAEAN